MKNALLNPYEERRREAVYLRIGGAPAESVAAWLSKIDKAERDGRPCPSWADLEEYAASLPLRP